MESPVSSIIAKIFLQALEQKNIWKLMKKLHIIFLTFYDSGEGPLE
jgi:hypothetical protein